MAGAVEGCTGAGPGCLSCGATIFERSCVSEGVWGVWGVWGTHTERAGSIDRGSNHGSIQQRSTQRGEHQDEYVQIETPGTQACVSHDEVAVDGRDLFRDQLGGIRADRP